VLFDGMTLMAGGFGLSGNPENCITAISRMPVRNMTVTADDVRAKTKAKLTIAT